jgi:tetratricopeptide (TPR) repeat protein
MKRLTAALLCFLGLLGLTFTEVRGGNSKVDYCVVGTEAYQAKKYSKAIKHFSKALESDPQDVDSLLHRGISYYRISDLKKARADLNRVLSIDPDNHRAINYSGIVALKEGKYDLAFRKFKEASDVHESTRYLTNAALALYRVGYYALGEKYCREALLIDGSNESARKLMYLCHKADRQQAERKQRLQASLTVKKQVRKANWKSSSSKSSSRSGSQRRRRG